MSDADEEVENVEAIHSSPASGAPGRSLSSAISSITATAFIIGIIGGLGMLSLPFTMAETGVSSFFLIVLLGLTTMNNGVCLARSWMLLEDSHPELQGQSRNPLSEMARRALGVPGKIIAVVCLLVNITGICITYLLMVGTVLQYVFVELLHVSKCYWSIAFGIFMLPFALPGSLKDFWLFGYLACATTILVWSGVVTQLFLKYLAPEETRPEEADSHSFFETLKRIGLGLGPIMMSYTDIVFFPYIQTEMKDRSRFSHSVVAALCCLISMYLILAWMIYLSLGMNDNENLMITLVTTIPGPVTNMIMVFAAIHFPAVFCIMIIPLFRQLEYMFNISDKFAVPRVLFRMLLLGFIILVALIIPDVKTITYAFSYTTMSISTYILPPALYLSVISADNSRKKWWSYHLALMTITIGLAGVGSVYSTYKTVADILETGLKPSCMFHIYKCNNMTGNSSRICVQME